MTQFTDDKETNLAMLLAVLTDIHANQEALSACLEHAAAQGANQYAFLGDLVGYGADPVWVLDTVMDYAKHGAHVLLGNHDEALLLDHKQGMNPIALQVVQWTLAQLQPHHLQFIRALPFSIQLPDLLLVHANAWAPAQWEYVDGVMEATRSLHACKEHVTFCGHMHMPGLYHMTLTGKTGEFTPNTETTIPLSRQRRWLVIPGSVGQPRDGNPAACYATLNTETLELSYFRVPYDAETAAKKIIAAGLPSALGERLLVGA